MALIIELGVVFAICFPLAVLWQRMRGHSWAAALHRGFVAAIIIMLSYFVLMLVTDMLNLKPEPGAV